MSAKNKINTRNTTQNTRNEDNVNDSWSTEETFTLSQMKEFMKLQQDTILQMFNMTIDRLDKKIDFMKEEMFKQNQHFNNEIASLKASIEFTEKENCDKFAHVRKKMEEVKTDLDEAENMNNLKLSELEDRNRRNNLRFNNIDELERNEFETWEKTEKIIKDVIKEDLEINEHIEIERAHRNGKKTDGKRRSIVVKFLNFKDKEKVKQRYIDKKLWESKLYINDDYSERTTEIRKELFKTVKKLKEEGKNAKVAYKSIVYKKPKHDK